MAPIVAADAVALPVGRQHHVAAQRNASLLPGVLPGTDLSLAAQRLLTVYAAIALRGLCALSLLYFYDSCVLLNRAFFGSGTHVAGGFVGGVMVTLRR